ncbi:MAG TPA: hypothetical protein VFV33_12180, partial [Gemmatimonadaceae bacterium]|nr:hypothetical protein [Gemmatimonadaceae bacterium]
MTVTIARVPRSFTVSRSGAGSGTVTSVPVGVSCPGTCSATFGSGLLVTLSAAPAPGSVFAGWTGGGCTTLSDQCNVLVNAAMNVTARFELRDATPPNAHHVTFTQLPPTAIAGVGLGVVQAEIRDANNQRVWTAGDLVTLSIGTNPSAGALVGTASVRAVNGVVTWANTTISVAGVGYTLVASASGLFPATSDPFDVIELSGGGSGGVGTRHTRIRTGANCTGQLVGNMTMQAGQTLTLRAAEYTPLGVCVADTPSTWASTGSLPSVSAGPSTSTVFAPAAAGLTGTISARPTDTQIYQGVTGSIFVVGGNLSRIRIRDQAGGLGNEVGAVSLSTDETRTFYAAGYDAAGN